MKNLVALSAHSFVIVVICAFLHGCAMNRISSTEKTAVERALISQSLSGALHQLDANGLQGETFYIPPQDQLRMGPNMEVGAALVEGLLSKHLIDSGLSVAHSRDDATIIIEPTVHFSQIDDNKMVLGLPSIPVPAAGSIFNTPEVALLGLSEQYGRSQVSVTITDAKTGERRATLTSEIAQSKYNRWTLLVFIGWRVTDLPAPF